VNKQDENVYGAVLYLDGIRVKGKKTFKKRTLFFGFKEGSGNYRSFVFNLNEMLNEHGAQDPVTKPCERLNEGGYRDQDEASLETRHSGKIQTIIVEVFETEEF